MTAVFLIARRELAAYLKTWSGYIIIAGGILAIGFLFNVDALPGPGKKSGEILAGLFWDISGVTMLCALLLAMRLLAEERQTGTIELLYSSPVTDAQIVVGKFLSALAFLCVFLLVTSFLPALIFAYGKVSLGHIAAGYFGLLLVGSASLAIGTFTSSLTRYQVVAALIGVVLVLVLTLCHFLSRVTERPLSDVFLEMAWYPHFDPFRNGLVHLKHVVYFGAVTYVALFATTRVVEARRWK